MNLEWANELYERCKHVGIPFLFKQSSSIYTERGIDGLARYIADMEGRKYSADDPLIREYPATTPSLLPFLEHGSRYDDAEWLTQTEGVK
ncbi:MAG: hypothetical protein RB191_17590 [Terriglobia bacterium]|nr:hypothetical protein [Terriglobia bacterium]